MYFAKNDLVFLILLVLRIELNTHFTRYNSWESRSVELGSTSAYTQISHFSSYPHPKYQNDFDSILFSRLNYFSNVRENLITWIVPDHQTASTSAENTVSELPDATENLELTREDMNLIEILWKQDIDLGVSREAYDSRQQTVEDGKDIEFVIEKDFYDQKDVESFEEPDLVPEPFSGLNYTIDSETGEYLIDGFSNSVDPNVAPEDLHENEVRIFDKNKLFEDELLKEFESFNPTLNSDSYLPFEDDQDFCNLSLLFPSNEISEFTSSEIPELSSDLNYISSQDTDESSEQFELSNEDDGENIARGEMSPNIEDCWPDTYQGTDALLMHADFQPSSIGSSNIGYAVAESIATLTNDTDPLPTSSDTKYFAGGDLPEIFYSNHTAAQNDISDFFLDELQLMTLPSNDNANKQREEQMDTNSDSISSEPLTSDYHEWVDSCSESSSHYDDDSKVKVEQQHYVSSLRRVPLSSNNGNCDDANFQQMNSNDPQYFSLKTYYPSENSAACAAPCDVVNKKFDYSISKGRSNFIQHNHTYHLPFNNDDSCHKQKAYSDDEISNKDEKRAKELKLPISISDIINLAIEEYNERLSKYELTEAQITLIRDIRRRGKNKVAAQNCRKRKMDQINNLQQDLDFLQNEKLKLKSKQNHLLQQKHMIEEKYIQLYELVIRNPSNMSNENRTTELNGGARTKKKFKK